MTDPASQPTSEPSREQAAPADADAGGAQSPRRPALPPDPAEYDSPRAAAARARGLSAPYISGGRDPNPEKGLREERYYGRLLLLMVIIIVASGFVLGIVFNVLNALGGG